jgi:hypothetical protein
VQTVGGDEIRALSKVTVYVLKEKILSVRVNVDNECRFPCAFNLGFDKIIIKKVLHYDTYSNEIRRRNVSKEERRAAAFHKLTHILCIKPEMNNKHFIDVYGRFTTPVNPNMTLIEETCGGFITAEYQV